RPELHERLVVAARPARWHELARELPEARLARTAPGIARHAEEPREDAGDVAVDEGRRPIERDRGDRARGVGPDSRQGAERRLVLGEAPAKLARDDLR